MNAKNIPSSWSDIPLSIGKQIFSLDKTALTDDQLIGAVYNILTDHEYNELPITEVSEIREQIVILLAEKPSGNLKRKFTVSGKDYYLNFDLSRATWGEFIDLEMLIDRANGNIWGEIENILGIIIRPAADISVTKYNTRKRSKKADTIEVETIEMESYNAHSARERSELFLAKLCTADIFPIALFFYLAASSYLKVLLGSLKDHHQTQNIQEPSPRI